MQYGTKVDLDTLKEWCNYQLLFISKICDLKKKKKKRIGICVKDYLSYWLHFEDQKKV